MGRSVIRAAVAALLVGAGLTAFPSTIQAVAGTPQAPVVVFTEDFENGQGAVPILLPAYVGAAGQSYTADPAWLVSCNGLVASLQQPPNDPTGGQCNSRWPDVKRMAGDLGQWAGGDRATNHALSAYTETNPGANKVQFETAQPIALSATNRFLTFSVDAAEQNCYALHALLAFYLLDGPTAIPTFTNPIETCANPGQVVNGTSVGTFASDKPVLFTGSSLGIRLVNLQGSGNGNDAAIDNVRVLDVTPQLDVSFSPASAEINTPATLTYTVTNTTELAVKTGWSFFGALPNGLKTTASPTTDCADATATAAPGATAVSVEGALATGQTSCTVSVPVTATRAGTYTTCAADVSQLVGLNPPGCASVVFVPPVLGFDAHAHGGKLTSPLLSVGPLAPADLDCTTTPGTDSDQLASASLPGVGSLGVITTSASGVVAPDGLRTTAASARTAGLSLLGGLVTADEVKATATATDDLSGVVTATGTTNLTNLRVAGVQVLNPAVDQTIVIPLVASVVVNERVPVPGGIVVNAVHVKLLTGTDLVVSQARARLGC
ncbi:choice-of-anchor P family protein [Umezawaea sp. Da 62-37]|uniref:choice-of-anchor P family protein n=1 Tax=Umezawaea sp. Da 62-37 TaxID=3075927 RepID=UPI0028F6C551|nr:choice-of-anchor P family protein [Umezawaea sp. Da 62-37]WNV90148.1 choice-of-anchor P family protein [Umezawaea sp. Da 62-37]